MSAGEKHNAKETGFNPDSTTAAESLAAKVRDGAKAATRAAEDAGATVQRRVKDAADALGDGARRAGAAIGEATDLPAVDEIPSRVGRMIDQAQETAQEAKDAIVTGAGNTLSAVRDVAVEKADEARESLSDVGHRLAATLQRASDDSDADALRSRVLSSVAQGLTSASDALRQRSVSDLGSDIKLLARRHPGAFMAAAAVAGFAAARFLRSSAQRRHADIGHDQGPRV